MIHYNKLNNIVIDFLSGGIAGSIAKTITSPLEIVKLIHQTQSNEKYKKNGIFLSIKYLIKKKGIFSLWRGNLSNILRYFPLQAINFSVKSQIDDIINGKFNNNQELINKHPYEFFLRKLLCGGLTGAIGLFCVYPLDFTRTKLGVDVKKEYKGIFDCLKKTIKKRRN